MKKFIGFGVLLALIVAPVAMANAQDTTVNLFPMAFGTFAGLDTYLSVSNLTQVNFALDDGDEETTELGSRIIIKSRSQGGVQVIAASDLLAGETRIYASNSSVHPRNFSCTNDFCTVVVCAPVGDNTASPAPVTPVISSSLFWLNNGQFYAITSPLSFIVDGNLVANCPDYGVPPSEVEGNVIP